MGFDTPPPAEINKLKTQPPAEHLVLAARQAAYAQVQDSPSSGASGTERTAAPEISPEIGTVKKIVIQGNWIKLHDKKIPPQGFHGENYNLNGKREVSILVRCNDGVKPSPDVSNAISQLLHQPDRKLKIGDREDDKEIALIRNAFEAGEAPPEDFTISSIETKTVNGKRLLFVQGDFTTPANAGLHALTVYIDSDPSRPGAIPESISYVADTTGDPGRFEQYLQAAKTAFKSMIWK